MQRWINSSFVLTLLACLCACSDGNGSGGTGGGGQGGGGGQYGLSANAGRLQLRKSGAFAPRYQQCRNRQLYGPETAVAGFMHRRLDGEYAGSRIPRRA
ncbi:MAG TPA: hypothetical protein EYQ18_19335 [Candidatus Handelsmanbacteria bacterium]|nr:hypothetical protein [Candidatus Handelsmanbacteria bacterium]